MLRHIVFHVHIANFASQAILITISFAIENYANAP